MVCNKCGRQLPEGSIFCSSCGNRQDGNKVCPGCQNILSNDVSYCNYCGKNLITKKQKFNNFKEKENKNHFALKIMSIIICIALFISSLSSLIVVNFSDYTNNYTTADFKINSGIGDFAEAAALLFSDYTTQDFTYEVQEILTDNISNTQLSSDFDSLSDSQQQKIINTIDKINIFKIIMTDKIKQSSPLGVVIFIIFTLVSLAMAIMPVIFICFLIISLVNKKTFKFLKTAFIINFILSLIFIFLIGETNNSFYFGCGLIFYIIFCILGIGLNLVYDFILEPEKFIFKPVIKKAVVSLSTIILMIMLIGSTVLFSTTVTINGKDRTYTEGISSLSFLSTLDNYINKDFKIDTLANNTSTLVGTLSSNNTLSYKKLFMSAFGYSGTIFNNDMNNIYGIVILLTAFMPFLTFASLGIMLALLIKMLRQLMMRNFSKPKNNIILNSINIFLLLINLAISVLLVSTFNNSANYQNLSNISISLSVMPFFCIALSVFILLFQIFYKETKQIKTENTETVNSQSENVILGNNQSDNNAAGGNQQENVSNAINNVQENNEDLNFNNFHKRPNDINEISSEDLNNKNDAK